MNLAIALVPAVMTHMTAGGCLQYDSFAAEDFYFPSTGVRVENKAVLLAIDNSLMPLRENLGTCLSTPTYREKTVLCPSKDNPFAPDQVAAHFLPSRFFRNVQVVRFGYPGQPRRRAGGCGLKSSS